MPNENIADSKSFKFKAKITESTHTKDNATDVEIAVPIKY